MHLSSFIKALLVSTGALVLMFGIYQYERTQEQLIFQSSAERDIQIISSHLQARLDTTMHLTEVLAAFVRSETQFSQEEFDLFTAGVESGVQGIISLQLAPQGIVSFVSQLERNRAAIGHNLLGGEQQRVSALNAIEQKKKIVVGPINLIQGGRALIARQPIFEDEGLPGEKFWGFATVLIDIDLLVESVQLANPDAIFAIRGVGEDGQPSDAFIGKNSDFDTAVTSKDIQLGASSWRIALLDDPSVRLLREGGFIFTPWYWVFTLSILTAVFAVVYRTSEQPYLLRAKIAKATESLEATLEKMHDENEKRNRLYGMVAHELRTPVATISMLSTTDDQNEWLSHQGTVNIAATTLLDTIDDMRLVINPNLKRPLRYESFRIEDLESQIVASTQSTLSSSKFELIHQIEGGDLIQQRSYVTDVYRIRVATINLIRNACLHSGGNRVNLTFNIRFSAPDNTSLEIIVADNGGGIESEIENTLFDPEVRGQKTTAIGTGLGLHIAKTWIEEIGGSLKLVQAQPSACFQIVVPLINEDPNLDEGNQPVDETALRKLVKNWRVLFVEDDMMLRMIGSKFMEAQVAQVHPASNGADALALLESQHFDLIITDYFMPIVNGDELIKSARKLGFEGIILGLTAATLGDQVNVLKEAGADAVMAKPISRSNFYRTLAQAMQSDESPS